MTSRVRFDLAEHEPFSVLIDGERFGYRGSTVYAEIGDVPAGITNLVFALEDGRFARVTVIADDAEGINPLGVHHGWYAARLVDASEAAKTKASWAVLRDQPRET